MNIKEVASAIAKAEGHNFPQARIGDIKEIISILADMSYKSPDPLQAIISLGIARAKRKKPSKVEPKS